MKRLYRSVSVIGDVKCAVCERLGRYQFIDRSGNLDSTFCKFCVPSAKDTPRKNGCWELDLDEYICKKRSYRVTGKRLFPR